MTNNKPIYLLIALTAGAALLVGLLTGFDPAAMFWFVFGEIVAVIVMALILAAYLSIQGEAE